MAKIPRMAASTARDLVTAGGQGPRSVDRSTMRAPITRPAPNPTRATNERRAAAPCSCARCRPRSTVLPVMFAVNTWPSARKLTASTLPAAQVSARSRTSRRCRSIHESPGEFMTPAFSPTFREPRRYTSRYSARLALPRRVSCSTINVSLTISRAQDRMTCPSAATAAGERSVSWSHHGAQQFLERCSDVMAVPRAGGSRRSGAGCASWPASRSRSGVPPPSPRAEARTREDGAVAADGCLSNAHHTPARFGEQGV